MSPEDLRVRARVWRWILVGLACFWATLATLVFPPAPRLVWNASDSAPQGLYRVLPGSMPGRGEMVIAWAPAPYRHLAATRHYLPGNVPLVKRVAALAGDRVCATGPTIRVDGKQVATRLAVDGKGRPMPWWDGCRTLSLGEYLLLMDAPASFDGRYFGISRADQLVGKARPLWTR
jgi:conjugative transfer signal peptidase TraF